MLRRLRRRAATLISTLAVIAIAGLAVQQGAHMLAQRAEAVTVAGRDDPMPVSTALIEMSEGYETTRKFLGKVEPSQSTTLGFEFAGRITEILVDEGDAVVTGASLARVDTRLLETELARLAAARDALVADLRLAEISQDRRQELLDRGVSPQSAVDEARYARASLQARIDEIDAQIDAVGVRLEKSVLRAPYAGRVGSRSADTGATVAAGEPVVELLQDDAMQVRIGLPLWVDAAVGAVWNVDIGAHRVAGEVVSLRPDVDPETLTRTAIVRLAAVDVPFGATATVSVPRVVRARGAWVPMQALREGAPGVWTVLVVDATQTVRAAPVEVLHAEADRVFVAGGILGGSSLIDGGPHRVTPGQAVSVRVEH
jgi:RND family efflux transporter MFP subunit